MTDRCSTSLQDHQAIDNAMSLRWVSMRIGGQGAGVSATEGDDTPVRLATLPYSGPRGGRFHLKSGCRVELGQHDMRPSVRPTSAPVLKSEMA